MGKKLDMEMKQIRGYYRQRAKKRFKNPYICPVCCKETLWIKKLEKNDEKVTWKATCKCGFTKILELPPIFEIIDVYTKMCDKK